MDKQHCAAPSLVKRRGMNNRISSRRDYTLRSYSGAEDIGRICFTLLFPFILYLVCAGRQLLSGGRLSFCSLLSWSSQSVLFSFPHCVGLISSPLVNGAGRLSGAGLTIFLNSISLCSFSFPLFSRFKTFVLIRLANPFFYRFHPALLSLCTEVPAFVTAALRLLFTS